MSIESLKIKNQSYYYWNDTIYIDDFDIKYLKINNGMIQYILMILI